MEEASEVGIALLLLLQLTNKPVSLLMPQY
jgi:hypothetical protein